MAQETSQNGPQPPTAAMPPAMAEIKSQSADEVLAEMNRLPLFMTTLDETDGESGDNPGLEALKALAYEGTRAEVAENFRQQGNECARAKQWDDAKEFYDKAIAALKAPKTMLDPEDGPPVIDVDVELDDEEEAKKEKATEEACYVNRALCNLEKKNYRSCIYDCATTLRINPNNVKAFYRSGLACLSLDKIPEATDACMRGLSIDSGNGSLKTLKSKIAARKAYIDSVDKIRREREEKVASERATLSLALKSRGIKTKSTEQAPDLEDAVIRLENPLDPSSTLNFPVLILYPTHSQSDFIKAFAETDTLKQHLDYVFPLPWDTAQEFKADDVEVYMETIAGGLIKVGKKSTLGKVLGSGKCEIVDGLAKMSVIPKVKAPEWIAEFKKRRGN